ncbi:hypothetical protein KP509_17G069500 [Ceratopteris richardii]|uniref:Uncharacterized protein n=1 Tax=Ceratopteris richardii TaxID=49495 RepID=A0A8T2T0G7_CERRI|nr:hypothetical protein KP509_17G069500 [Ceratopteris richardii]
MIFESPSWTVHLFLILLLSKMNGLTSVFPYFSKCFPLDGIPQGRRAAYHFSK